MVILQNSIGRIRDIEIAPYVSILLLTYQDRCGLYRLYRSAQFQLLCSLTLEN